MIQHINANKVLILTDTVSREQKKDKKKKFPGSSQINSDCCHCEFLISRVHIQYFY